MKLSQEAKKTSNICNDTCFASSKSVKPCKDDSSAPSVSIFSSSTGCCDNSEIAGMKQRMCDKYTKTNLNDVIDANRVAGNRKKRG
jgi:hypothetical protein